MPFDRPPMRLLRVVLITLLLLAAIVTLVPDEPQAVPSADQAKALAAADAVPR